MYAAPVVDDVEFAILILGKRGNTERCIHQFLADCALLTRCRNGPDPALDKISIHVKAL